MQAETLGERVTLALSRSGKSDKAIATEIGRTAAWVSSVKNDRMDQPDPEGLQRLAIACNVDPLWFAEAVGWKLRIDPHDWEANLRRLMRADPKLADSVIEAVRPAVELAKKRTEDLQTV